MNRFLLGAYVLVLFGCGARTESFTDLDGAGGQSQGMAGAPTFEGGAVNAAGAPYGHAGAPSYAGALQVAGAASVGGASPITGGSFGFGGALQVAGAASVGGAPPITGGSFGFGGGQGKAGAPSFGGSPNAAGAPGIIQACQVLAGNSCQQCLCQTCSSQILQCFSNVGCALVLACAEQTGCQGLACYRPKTCKSVIDQYGGLGGQALSDVLSLFSCSVGSQNSCNCN